MATFTLSTLDGDAPRAYIRYALTFACRSDQADAVNENLLKAVKRLVNEIPMLAGTVTTNDDQKPTVAITLEQVDVFESSIVHLENTHQSYTIIRRQGVAPREISGTALTPLEDGISSNANPSCAIQANFIKGGLILAIYLHHAIADIRGISTILRLMSEGLPLRKLSQESLEHDAAIDSQARARLSSGSGAPAFLSLARDVEQRQRQSRQQQDQPSDSSQGESDDDSDVPNFDAALNRAVIFRFKLNIIAQTTELVNSRRALRGIPPTDNVTPREVLIAILWRAYARARWPQRVADDVPQTSVSFPVDVRSHLVPPLELHWLGNAEVSAIANESLLLLGGRYDVSTIERTAPIIHSSAKAAASDLLARSRIEMMNAGVNLQNRLDAQLIVHDWTSVPFMPDQEMDLGLGLGRPDAIRRTGRNFGVNEMILLPVNEPVQAWEVQVELRRDWMAGMVRDEALRVFLWGVAQ